MVPAKHADQETGGQFDVSASSKTKNRSITGKGGFPAVFSCGSRVSRVIPTVVPVLIGRSEAGGPCHCPPAGPENQL